MRKEKKNRDRERRDDQDKDAKPKTHRGVGRESRQTRVEEASKR